MAEQVTRKSVEDLMRNPEILRAQSEVRAAEAMGMRSLPQPMGGSPTVTTPSPAATGITRRQQYGPPPNLPASPLQPPVPMSFGATMAAPQMSPMAAQPMQRATMGSAPTASRVQPRPSAQNISDRIRSGYYNQAGAKMGPDPADVMAARQRLAASQGLMNSDGRMVGGGGMPVSQARALSEGRQDAAARIANAKGRAMLPSAPSPLDGSAAFFQGLNERSAADRAEADKAWNAKMDRYRASRDADTNNNGIPDRDEAVASKYGNMGINNVNDLSDASAKYRNYLRAYRDSGMRGKARAMNFDEFAKGLQEQEKQLPVFDLAAASNVAPRERARPSERRVAAAQERSRLNELTVMGQNQGLNPMAARQFAMATLSNEKQLAAAQGEAQAQRAAAQALQETEAGARTSVAQIQAEQAGRNASALREQQEREFQERMEVLRANNELQKGRFGLEQTEAERRNQAQSLAIAQSVTDPAALADEEFGRAYSEFMLQFPNEPERVRAAALQRAQLAYNKGMREYSAAMASGLVPNMQPPSPFPSQFSFQPPDIAAVDLASGAAPATPEQISAIMENFMQVRGRQPTREELLKEMKQNGLMYSRSVADNLADAALGERGKKSWGFSAYTDVPGAMDAYSILHPEAAPNLGAFTWSYPHYDESGSFIDPYGAKQSPLQTPPATSQPPRQQRQQPQSPLQEDRARRAFGIQGSDTIRI